MSEAPLRVGFTLEQCWHEVPGGTAEFALRLSEALVADKVKVVGVAARHGSPPRPPYVPRVPMGFLGLPRVALYESWHRLNRPKIEKAVGPVDVIHATGMACPPRSAPLAVTLHDLAWRHFPSHATSRGNSFFEAALKTANKRADVFICPTQATADDAASQGIDADRLRVVHHGVTHAEADVDLIRALRVRHDIHGPFVLWVGTIEPRKNLSVLVRALEKVFANPEVDKRLSLVMAGPDGWNETLGPLERLAGRVKRVGFIPSAEMPALYAAANCFVFPSLLEGFGMPVLEAMAQRTPVITSDTPSLVEVVGGVGPSIAADDVDGFAEAITKMVTDEQHRAAASDRAAKRAQDFSWARAASEHHAIYRELASG